MWPRHDSLTHKTTNSNWKMLKIVFQLVFFLLLYFIFPRSVNNFFFSVRLFIGNIFARFYWTQMDIYLWKKKKHLLNWSIIQHLISVLCSGTCFRALILVLVLIFWSHSNGSKYSHTIAILKIELNFKFIENCLFWLWFKYCALCCASVRFSANLCAIQLPIM